MHLQESGEMYLETILILSKSGKDVRSVDVSEYMGFSKPSVSRAIGLLKSGGYVTMDKGGHLELTEEGRAVAENIYEKHTLLAQFLMTLGVDEATATEDACKMAFDEAEEEDVIAAFGSLSTVKTVSETFKALKKEGDMYDR